MKQILEQFKYLNPKDPGTWPALPKALALLVLFAAILGGAYMFDWSTQLEALDAGAAQEKKLKDEYKDRKQQAVNLDLYRQQLREIDSSFGALLKQLPNRSQMDALLVYLTAHCCQASGADCFSAGVGTKAGMACKTC